LCGKLRGKAKRLAHTFGECGGPLVLLHGGAGPMDPTALGFAQAVTNLSAIGKRAQRMLARGARARDVASQCCYYMELDPIFNAGVGSALQADGVARLSAALMDGSRQRFSGVVGASYLSHPSSLSRLLQQRKARVLSEPGTQILARELGLPVNANLTARRSKRWFSALASGQYQPLAASEATRGGPAMDTVGCLVRGARGELVAAASTGGRGFEYPGRVSDTCTVAGTYASKYAAVAATGVGEEIVDDALASRLETRVRDGMSLFAASDRCLREALERKRAYGWIALDRHCWCVAHTTPSLPFVLVGRYGRGARVLASSLMNQVALPDP
jgi:L-asparaginase